MWTNQIDRVGCALLFLALVSCAKENPYAQMTDAEIHQRAQSLSLAERYAFYLEVTRSSIPSNPIVADDLVLLGKPARDYVLKQALMGSRYDLTDALAALSAFRGECSKSELAQLRSKADRVAYGPEDRRAIEQGILVACELGVPNGMRNPWKDDLGKTN